MKMSRNSPCFKSVTNVRGAIALLIVATFLNLSLLSVPGVFAASHPEPAAAMAMMRVAGNVTMDGELATSGQTIFPGSRIITSEGSESIIHLGKLTRLRLSEKTEFTLDFSKTNLSGLLSTGVMRGFIPAGTRVNIRTTDAELVTDSSQPTAFIIEVDGETTEVSVQTGRVEVRRGDELQSVGVGQILATAGESPAGTAAQNNLTDRERLGILAAIAAAAAILVIAIIGQDEKEPDFGGCVIAPSGTTGQTGICP